MNMMMILIIVMCAQCGIQYLMTIHPPLILPLPIKPTIKTSNLKIVKNIENLNNYEISVDDHRNWLAMTCFFGRNQSGGIFKRKGEAFLTPRNTRLRQPGQIEYWNSSFPPSSI